MFRGHAAGQIAGARANVRDHFAGPEFQRVDQQRRFLFGFALRPFQPIGGLMSHDVRDLAAHVELPDAIRIVGVAPLIAIRFRGARAPHDRSDQEKKSARPETFLHGETLRVAMNYSNRVGEIACVRRDALSAHLIF